MFLCYRVRATSYIDMDQQTNERNLRVKNKSTGKESHDCFGSDRGADYYERKDKG